MSTLSVRRPLALLAVLGMVAALLFAVVGTASAATVPGSPAQFSACPENADIPDGGFGDVPTGSYISDAVDCIAYYGVTKGTTATTYSPLATITRVQMAVFLARAAEGAGVSLSSTPPSAGFTDIGTASAEAQDAINALADAGIVNGKTATTYAPSDPVSRTHMALFLTRFLDEAIIGPGGSAPDATPPTAPFTDIAGASTEAKLAINQAWDLVITTGTTATTYGPDDSVTRAQMALFTSRMMAHANTRPAGVNIQADPMSVEDPSFNPTAGPSSEYSVTVRNADFTPKTNARVDAFAFEAKTSTGTPFNTNGTCDLADTVSIYPGAHVECTLDSSDNLPDSEGNFDVRSVVFTLPFLTLYAWTGTPVATFNSLGTVHSSVMVRGVAETPDWDGFDFDVDSEMYVHLGDTVTWTVQLTDGGVDFAEAGVEVDFVDYWNDDITVLDSSTTTTTVETDATGKATYTQTETVESFHDVEVYVDPDGVNMNDCCLGAIIWTDDDPVVDSLKLSTPDKYQVIGTTAGSSSNAMTAMVYDQYGDLYTGTGEAVQFYRSSVAGSGDDGGPVILVGGVAARTYSWDWADGSDDEYLYASLVSDGSIWDDISYYYWALEGVDDDMSVGPGDVKVGDVDNNALVGYDNGDYWVLRWDSNDFFLDQGAASDQTAFEKAVKALDSFDVVYEATAAESSTWDLD